MSRQREFLILVLTALLCACTIQSEKDDRQMYGMSDEGIGADPHNAPTAKKGWSVAGELTTGLAAPTVSLQANFEPGDYTIQFNLIMPNTGGAAINVRAVALVTWSVEGNQVTRRVNVGNGVSISGNAEGVRVVISDSSDLTFVPLSRIPYVVAATITKGTRPSVEQPPKLYPRPGGRATYDTLAPAATIVYLIPADAGVISVFVSVAADPAGVNAPIPEQGVQVTQLGGTALAVYDPRASQFVPLAPGATQIAVTNMTAGQTIVVNCVFGIDG
jgi:hypothetical protein